VLLGAARTGECARSTPAKLTSIIAVISANLFLRVFRRRRRAQSAGKEINLGLSVRPWGDRVVYSLAATCIVGVEAAVIASRDRCALHMPRQRVRDMSFGRLCQPSVYVCISVAMRLLGSFYVASFQVGRDRHQPARGCTSC